MTQVDFRDVADFTRLERDGYGNRETGSIMLLGRIAGKCNDSAKSLLGSMTLSQGTSLYVLDILGVRDEDGVLGSRGKGCTYLTCGQVMFSGPTLRGIEGSLVYVRGAKLRNGTGFRKLKLREHNGVWSSLTMEREGNRWYVSPCSIAPLRAESISNMVLREEFQYLADMGILRYAEGVTYYGKLAWSKGTGILPPVKGSPLWKQRNEEGYSYSKAEGKDYWGRLDDGETCRKKGNLRGDEEDKVKFLAGSLPSTREGGQRWTNLIEERGKGDYNGGGERDRRNRCGFLKIPEDILQEVDRVAKGWSEQVNKVVSRLDEEGIQEKTSNFFVAVGKEWRKELEKDTQQAFSKATAYGWIPRVTGRKVAYQLQGVEKTFMKDKNGEYTSHVVKDFTEGGVSDKYLGALVVVTSMGIRPDIAGMEKDWAVRLNGSIKRMAELYLGCTDWVSEDSIIDLARLLILFGKTTIACSGIPEFDFNFHYAYSKPSRKLSSTCGTLPRMQNWYKCGREGGFTDELFRGSGEETPSVQGATMLVEGRECVSSLPYLEWQENTLFSVLRRELEEGNSVYYTTDNAVRGVVAWEKLRSLQDYAEADAVHYGTEDCGVARKPSERSGVSEAIAELEDQLGAELDESQLNAMEGLKDAPVGVLTGAAGTGKTTVVRGILGTYRGSEYTIILGAPTGKAAKRLQESTGMKARTLHSLFGIETLRGRSTLNWVREYTGFEGLETDYTESSEYGRGSKCLYVIDEASMMGFDMLCHVLGGVDREAGNRVLLVGDKEQLPPVQDPDIFTELLAVSERRYILERVHRDTKGGRITSNAYKVLEGKGGSLEESSNYTILNVDNSSIAPTIIGKYLEKVDEYGIDEVRVLSPFNKGKKATEWGYSSAVLNNSLLSALIDSGKGRLIEGTENGGVLLRWKSNGVENRARIGERVLNTVNTRRMPLVTIDGRRSSERSSERSKERTGSVMNGEEGRIAIILSEGNWTLRVLVDFGHEEDVDSEGQRLYYCYEVSTVAGRRGLAEEGELVYGGGIDNLELAYASTVHKMQGSEKKCIIMAVSSDVASMSFIDKAMLYTGITRASEEVVLIGSISGEGSAFAQGSLRKKMENPSECMLGVIGDTIYA